LSNVLIALQALDDLGGAAGFVDIEEVTLRAYELAPDRFGWRTKPYPSWERVRTAFVHANQQARRRGQGILVISNKSGDAWRLTAQGLQSSRAAPRSSIKTTVARGKRTGRSVSRVRELRRHALFKRFSLGTPASDFARYELADLLLCPPDSTLDVVVRKLDAAQAAARDVSDAEVGQFLDLIRIGVHQQWS